MAYKAVYQKTLHQLQKAEESYIAFNQY